MGEYLTKEFIGNAVERELEGFVCVSRKGYVKGGLFNYDIYPSIFDLRAEEKELVEFYNFIKGKWVEFKGEKYVNSAYKDESELNEFVEFVLGVKKKVDDKSCKEGSVKTNLETNQEFIVRAVNELLSKALTDRRDCMLSLKFLEMNFNPGVDIIELVTNVCPTRVKYGNEFFIIKGV